MGFKNWMFKGICTFKDLYNQVTLSFEQLVGKYGLPLKHFFKYLQIRSFVHSQIKSYSEPLLSTIEQLTLKYLNNRGNVSLFYNALLVG